MTDNNIRQITIGFNSKISNAEIPYFRAAVIATTEKDNQLFHNHDGDGFRYSYPLIQYKRIHQKASIVCIDEGVEAIGKFLGACSFDMMIGNRPATLEIESVKANKTLVQIWDSMFTYSIRKWLPFNHDNYAKYMSAESIADKATMLEKMLIGNILSFAKGMKIHLDKKIQCKIISSEEPRLVTYKGIKMMSFDVMFKTNVSLPNYIGLGKGVSLGFGTVVSDDKNDKTQYIHE